MPERFQRQTRQETCHGPESAAAAGSSAISSYADGSIRPFHLHVPEGKLTDLRRRLESARWPDPETVDDQSQGVQLAKLQELVNHWIYHYNWRALEARLNALPQFMTEIDGLDVYFMHVRSPHPSALPMIITHGWPGSPLEFLKVIEPLTNPIAHGGQAEDAFDLVIPALPGFGFSGKPREVGWGPDRVAHAWATLMKRLGYEQYVAQGGDWGATIAHRMAAQEAAGLCAIHVNLPQTVPSDVLVALHEGAPPLPGLSDEERSAFHDIARFNHDNAGYVTIQRTRPQTLCYGLSDSPVGLAAWMYDKFAQWTDTGGEPERSLTKDEMLDGITLYWLTESAASSARIYWEKHNEHTSKPAEATPFTAVSISVPAAVTVFNGETYRAPLSWTQRAYHKLIYFNRVSKGGHFAAWEVPDIFTKELRAAFRSLRQ
ncbi:epoxide hydrolase family protein [Streptomyces sp. NPDC059881]|uniref:epoxide hydrolase family protein n=1 Tax=Streptomyces sp. NPDC059881 TaxID=3346986 RepID=UPI003658085C